MSTLFSNRTLASSFVYRNVTLSSLGGISTKKVLMIKQQFDFGQMGLWSNSKSIDLEIYPMDVVLAELRNHGGEIQEQINMLDEITQWVKNGHKFPFQEVLMQEKPLLFNAFFERKTITVQIFGEGLNGLELRCDVTTVRGTHTLLERLTELRAAFSEHLKNVLAITFDRLVNKA